MGSGLGDVVERIPSRGGPVILATLELGRRISVSPGHYRVISPHPRAFRGLGAIVNGDFPMTTTQTVILLVEVGVVAATALLSWLGIGRRP